MIEDVAISCADDMRLDKAYGSKIIKVLKHEGENQ